MSLHKKIECVVSGWCVMQRHGRCMEQKCWSGVHAAGEYTANSPLVSLLWVLLLWLLLLWVLLLCVLVRPVPPVINTHPVVGCVLNLETCALS